MTILLLYSKYKYFSVMKKTYTFFYASQVLPPSSMQTIKKPAATPVMQLSPSLAS